MRINRRALPTAARALIHRADRLHPAALLVLVLLLGVVVHFTAPVMVTLLAAVVTAVQSAAYLAGSAVLFRLALRLAADFRATGTPATAPKIPAQTTAP
ncbi:hypothetical protein QMK19_33870 [Streptomyces sp. H10-C2]|uniref:hypothetical protein n=1 Tax=unclassified Streptomyces TaxID=2593676 RepID=UPI0024B97356|nr:MULTISPECIES: hypothetical protein [unclassified Streptomyces]MDJ0345536.1 hypothetical protein [Streptomyces sp. PH10-H1]MDJ0374482.1 hypothetical protein [Streptomyces sp. H10-C2]